MNIIKGFIIAFSMFSKIPMPNVKWDKENLRYMLCFFPFVGLVIGVIDILWFKLSAYLGLNNILFAAAAAVIPAVITGGIHFDGFMDCCDALASRKEKDEIIKILDDSHTGAFATLGMIIYFVLYLGAAACVKYMWQAYMLAIVFFAVRAVAVCIIITTDCLKKEGLLHTFKEGANKAAAGMFAAVYAILSVGMLESFNILIGILTTVFVFITLVCFIKFTVKRFGGISGDLIGYFICVCELVCVIVIGVGGALL